MNAVAPGKLILLSGPSGVGKSTVVREVLARYGGELRLSISATTRSPRPGERDGVDYHFLSPAEFARKREAGEFLECIEVFGQGHWYGTLRSEVGPSLAAGKWVVLEIDVEGALQVGREFPEAISLFIRPGTLEELERRLRGRGTEDEQSVARRLAVAQNELQSAKLYEYEVTNDTVPQAVDRICQILKDRGLCHD